MLAFVQLLVYHFAIRESHLAQMNSAPLYPTEELLWNGNLVPSEFFSGEECLALPKLGLQFLTLQDYLMRNFTLFRLESTFEIRQVRVYCAKNVSRFDGACILGYGFFHPAVGFGRRTVSHEAVERRARPGGVRRVVADGTPYSGLQHRGGGQAGAGCKAVLSGACRRARRVGRPA